MVALYDPDSILLPTLSSKPRFSPEEKADYFVEFMKNGPVGAIDLRKIRIGCNSAVDVGLYSFTFAATGTTVKARYSFTYQWDSNHWGITSHHSSLMPEGK